MQKNCPANRTEFSITAIWGRTVEHIAEMVLSAKCVITASCTNNCTVNVSISSTSLTTDIMRRHCSGLKALPSHPSHPTSFRILGVFAMLKRSARAIPPFNLGYKSRAVGSLRRGESVQSATISSDLSVSRVGP